jgi:hypothetical protein
MANTNAMQTINGIPLVEGTQVMYWGPPREGAPDIHSGRTGAVSAVYPDENLVMVHWTDIPDRPVQTTISMVPVDKLMSNELVAFDGSKLIVGSRVRFRGREDSDIRAGRCGTVRDILPEVNKVTVHWGDFPSYGSRTNPSAYDLVAEERQ